MRSNGDVEARTHIHHALQVVNVDIVHHVRFAEAEVRRSKHPRIKEIVVDRNSDGVSTLLIRPEAVDSL